MYNASGSNVATLISKKIFPQVSVNSLVGFGKQVGRILRFPLSKSIPRLADTLCISWKWQSSVQETAAFWTRSDLDFRARFACLRYPNLRTFIISWNFREERLCDNDRDNDRGFFLNERCLSTRRNNPGFDLARKQGCAFSLTLRRRYVLLIAASISLLTQRGTVVTIL